MADSISATSAQPCGCDPGAKWVCDWHKKTVAGQVDLRRYEAQTEDSQYVPGKDPVRREPEVSRSFAVAASERVDAALSAWGKEHLRDLIGDGRGTLTPPKGEKPTNPKNPIGSDKVPLHLWPPTATAYGSMGLLDGGLKYGIANYRVAGVRASIYIAALQRHIAAWYDAGEECAEDSGVEHLGHALACLAIIIDAKEQGVLVDDRPPRSAFNRLCARLAGTVARLRKQHVDKNPRHFTIADSDLAPGVDPKENA